MSSGSFTVYVRIRFCFIFFFVRVVRTRMYHRTCKKPRAACAYYTLKMMDLNKKSRCRSSIQFYAFNSDRKEYTIGVYEPLGGICAAYRINEDTKKKETNN